MIWWSCSFADCGGYYSLAHHHYQQLLCNFYPQESPESSPPQPPANGTPVCHRRRSHFPCLLADAACGSPPHGSISGSFEFGRAVSLSPPNKVFLGSGFSPVSSLRNWEFWQEPAWRKEWSRGFWLSRNLSVVIKNRELWRKIRVFGRARGSCQWSRRLGSGPRFWASSSSCPTSAASSSLGSSKVTCSSVSSLCWFQSTHLVRLIDGKMGGLRAVSNHRATSLPLTGCLSWFPLLLVQGCLIQNFLPVLWEIS